MWGEGMPTSAGEPSSSTSTKKCEGRSGDQKHPNSYPLPFGGFSGGVRGGGRGGGRRGRRRVRVSNCIMYIYIYIHVYTHT